MNEISGGIITGIMGILGGIVAGFFAGRQQKKLEYEKWLRVREDDSIKEVRIAVAELTRKLGEVSHSMTWLTWKASYQPNLLTYDDISTYNREMHTLLPALIGSLALVSALSVQMYEKMNQLVEQVYQLDVDIAKGITHFNEVPEVSIKEIGACHVKTAKFLETLNREVAQIIEGDTSKDR